MTLLELRAQRLLGKRAVVTGAAAGIGLGCVRRLVAEGAQVACLDIDDQALARLGDELGSAVLTVQCDVASEEAVDQAFAQVVAEFGVLDVGVLGAGVQLAGQDAAVDSMSLAAWERTMAVNLTGMFLSARATTRAMLAGEGGSIAIIGSPTGVYGMEIGRHAYSASKGGVHGLARVMAAEYAGQIRVNLVLPGFVDTALNGPLLQDPYALQEALAVIPMRRAAHIDEIAGVVAWLCSDDASYATGALFTVDGGLTAI